MLEGNGGFRPLFFLSSVIARYEAISKAVILTKVRISSVKPRMKSSVVLEARSPRLEAGKFICQKDPKVI